MANDELEISYWSSTRSSEEDYRLVKEAGFTHAFIDENHSKRGSKDYLDIFSYCEHNGLGSYIFNYNSPEKFLEDHTDYSLFPSFSGMIFWDEPSAKSFKVLGELAEVFEKRYPGKTFFVNLLPIYVILYDTKATLESLTGVADYESYLSLYCSQVLSRIKGRRVLSVDFYPFCKNKDDYYLEENWLANLELVQKKAHEYQAEPFFYIQSCEFGEWRREPKYNDFLLQFYVSLAYGVKGINYFTYSTPDSTPAESYQEALVDRSYVPTSRYDIAKEVNEYFRLLSKTLFSYHYVGTAIFKGEEPLDKHLERSFALLHNQLKEIDSLSISSSRPLVVGVFEKDKKKAYLLTHYSDPSAPKENKITIKSSKALQDYDSKTSSSEFSFSLSPGEGRFLLEK